MNVDGSFYTWRDVFNKSLGWHLFNKSTESEFNRFGPGIALYFKLIKYEICLFFLLFLVSLPLLIFYIKIGMHLILADSSLTLFDRIYLTTVGVVGEGSPKSIDITQVEYYFERVSNAALL